MSAPFRQTFRPRLVMQDAPRVQALLFAPEPRTEPPCDHPATETQRTLYGADQEVCSLCLRVLSSCAGGAW